jgi:cobalt/nickel transport protein
MAKKNIALIVLVMLIGITPLVINKGAEFGGSDDAAGALIAQLRPSYKPWFSSIWEPPSGEIASMLFALQAALGAGFVCFFFGYYIGKRKGEEAARRQSRN